MFVTFPVLIWALDAACLRDDDISALGFVPEARVALGRRGLGISASATFSPAFIGSVTHFTSTRTATPP